LNFGRGGVNASPDVFAASRLSAFDLKKKGKDFNRKGKVTIAKNANHHQGCNVGLGGPRLPSGAKSAETFIHNSTGEDGGKKGGQTASETPVEPIAKGLLGKPLRRRRGVEAAGKRGGGQRGFHRKPAKRGRFLSKNNKKKEGEEKRWN